MSKRKVAKYALVGSHGTGKSSAASHLASKLKEANRTKSVKVIEENVREISKLFGDRLNGTDFQRLVMIDHIHKELTAEQIYDIVVCDRSAIDTLVYGLVYNIELPSEYFSLAMNHLNTCKHVYFIRPDDYSSPLANDGYRDTDINMRNEVDKQFERMLKLWGGPYTEVRAKDVYKFDYIQHIKELDEKKIRP